MGKRVRISIHLWVAAAIHLCVGCGAYRSVEKAQMLSAYCVPAKGCVFAYSRSSTAHVPFRVRGRVRGRVRAEVRVRVEVRVEVRVRVRVRVRAEG